LDIGTETKFLSNFIFQHPLFLVITSCDYEVPGIILLRDLNGTMQLDRSKDMSVHVSTCISYNLNALTPVVPTLWR